MSLLENVVLWLRWRDDVIPDFRQQLDIAVSMLQQGSFPRP
jgi:hypothetical protein